MILGHPFQECRVYSPGEISLNPEDYSGPELINYREGTGPVGLDRIKWTGDYLPRQGPFGNSDAFDSANNSAVQENFFGTIRDYQFIGGPNDAENWEAAPSLGTSLTGRIFFRKVTLNWALTSGGREHKPVRKNMVWSWQSGRARH